VVGDFNYKPINLGILVREYDPYCSICLKRIGVEGFYKYLSVISSSLSLQSQMDRTQVDGDIYITPFVKQHDLNRHVCTQRRLAIEYTNFDCKAFSFIQSQQVFLVTEGLRPTIQSYLYTSINKNQLGFII